MDVVVILLLNLCCCMAASLSLPAPPLNSHSHPHGIYADHHPYLSSHIHRKGDGLYEHMPRGLNSLPRRSDSELMVEEDEFILSSIQAHEKRELDALLSIRKAITRDPYDILSNWRAENSEKICSSWSGISCTYQTKRVVGIDLEGKEMEGEIPTSIGSMSLLRLLNLSSNHLEGKIPASLGGISTLEQLDLANNNLSGPIPEELSKLYGLSILDVSSNNLCGRIPIGTQFSTFNATSFQKNKCLWGCPLDPCNENERPSKKGTNSASMSSNVRVGWLSCVDEKMSLVALGIGMGIGFGGVVAVFMLCERAKHWVVPPNRPQPFFGVYRFPT